MRKRRGSSGRRRKICEPAGVNKSAAAAIADTGVISEADALGPCPKGAPAFCFAKLAGGGSSSAALARGLSRGRDEKEEEVALDFYRSRNCDFCEGGFWVKIKKRVE